MFQNVVCFPPYLQLFADGTASADGDTGAGSATADNVGVATYAQKGAKNPLAAVQYGKQDVQDASAQQATQIEGDERAARFEAMIKGEFKDLYDARVSDTVKNRLKSSKETVDKYNALSPTLEILGKKYGVDASDIDALNKAIEDDDAYFEEEAMEKGISVEQLKSIRKMEKENADLKAQMQEQSVRENADRIYADWMDQSNKLTQIYPRFNLESELQNQQFVNLLKNNIDVRTAYEVIHKDEIIPAAMAFTANRVQRQITNKIMSQGARPTENGVSSQSAAIVKSDVSQLSKADRAEIARRAARGERIIF